MRGELIAARQETEQARSQFSSSSSPWHWKFCLLEANVDVVQGRGNDALALLADMPSQLASTDIGIQRAMLQATAYARLGDMTQADENLRQAQLLSDQQHSMLAGELFRTKGVIDIERNDLAHAQEMFRKSLEVARLHQDKFLLSSALLNLSAVALQQEHFDEALDWSRSAADTAQAIDARVIQEKSQGNMAWADYKLGNFEEALTRFQLAEQAAGLLGATKDRVEWLNNTGLSFYRLGQVQKAEEYYKDALNIAESIQYQAKIIEAHQALASLYVQEEKLDEAAQHNDQALVLAKSGGRKLDEMDALFLQSLIAIQLNKTDTAEKTLAGLDADPEINPSLHWQVEGALANLYAQKDQTAEANKWYRQSIVTFESQRKTLRKDDSKLPFSTNASQLYDDYIYFLIRNKKIDEALQWLDLGHARTLEEGLGIASTDFNVMLRHPVNALAIARRLRGTILVYNLAPRKSYLWAITAAGTRFFELPGSAEIDTHIRNYQRAILASKDTLANASVDGIDLYKVLIEPVQNLIPKNSPVFIIPDGSLQTLNFETLLAPNGGLHYWIEDATITDASSLKLLAAFQPEQRSESARKLLLIGNPVSPEAKFPDLPHASAEVSSIAEHFPSAEESIFTQKQALPSAYSASSPGEFSYIHFVAHGTSSSASPLDSAIVLTRSPSNPDAFKLYARDIMQHPLHASLVTISACYGSGSRIYGGEGLVGLSWAFLRAGAHYVVGSLWEVSDSATPQLMDRMYGELAGGQSPDRALRDAKLSLLHSSGIYRKPLYWATFQLYGGA